MLKRSTAVFLVLLLLSITACNNGANNQSDSWAVELGGNGFPVSELEYFVLLAAHAMQIEIWQETGQVLDLFEPGQFDQTAYAIERGLEQFKYALALIAFAEYQGVTLSAHLHEAMREGTEQFLAEYRERTGRDNRIGKERLMQLDSTELLYQELVEALHQYAEVDMEVFNELFEEMLTVDRWDFIEMRLSYYVAPTIPAVNDFIFTILGGKTFHEALAYFTDSEINDDEERGIDFWSFVQTYRMQDIEDARAIASLGVGEHSHIIQLANGFAVVYMESYIEPDIDEVRNQMLELYEAEIKMGFAWEMFLQFFEELEFEVNTQVVNSINVRQLIGD